MVVMQEYRHPEIRNLLSILWKAEETFRVKRDQYLGY